MAVSSDIKKQQNKSSTGAAKKKNGLLAKLKDPKKAIMDGVMGKVMGSMGMQSPEEMQADMSKNMAGSGPEAAEAEAVEREDIKEETVTSDEGATALEKDTNALKEEDYNVDEPSDVNASESEKNAGDEPTTDHVDQAGEAPTTDHVDQAGEKPDPTKPTLNQPALNQPAAEATPHEEQPSINEPTDADVQPPAMATPHQDKPDINRPEQKEPDKPQEMSNPTLKEKPSKSDPKLKPKMDLPSEGDL